MIQQFICPSLALCSAALLAIGLALLRMRLLRAELRWIGEDSAHLLNGKHRPHRRLRFAECRQIVQALEALDYKNHANAFGGGGSSGSPAVHDFIRELEDTARASREEFLRRFLTGIRSGFRAKGIAISYLLPDSCQIRTVSAGIAGERFNHCLTVEMALRLKEEESENRTLPHPRFESDVLNFSVFGIFSTVSDTFTWTIPGVGQARGALWWGYSEARPPAEDEPLRALEVVLRLEREVGAYEKLISLSEKAAQAQERTEMLAQMSHDIRSPLNNIKSILSLFKIEGLAIDRHEMIETALKNCESMAEIVEDLLDFSRHRMGRLSASPSLFGLRDLLTEVVQSYSVPARAKGLNLNLELRDANCMLKADRSHLKRVFANLISNAIKYTRHGGVSVTVTRDGGCVTVSIRDSGFGMNEEQMRGLFKPFTRFHAHAAEGVGLGLALSKALLNLNGGSINVSSTEGHGTEFRVTLAAHDTIAPTEENLSLQGMKVVLVDDDRDCADSLGRLLTKEGCEVRVAYTVYDAISIINFEPPEVIITDDRMPGGGGYQILQFAVRKSLSSLVVVLSGHDCRQEDYRAAARVMLKPPDFSELKRVLLTKPRLPRSQAAA